MTLQQIGSALPQVAEVDHDDIEVPCRECNDPVPYKSSVLAFFGNNKRIVVCDRCCDEAEHREKKENRFKVPMLPLQSMIPVYYLETDFNKLPKQAQSIWRYGHDSSPPIQQWNPNQSRGIYILGASRTGKTRTLCTLLRRIHGEGVNFKLFEAGQFHAALNDAKRSSFYTRWRDEVISYPVLAIDDLFAEKLTETVQAGLFEIIEQRMGRKLPILITTQVKRSDAIKQFSDPRRGEAFLNRLKESCDLYVTNQSQLQETINES